MADSLSRKLAVILHADVVGSTRLVQLDETLAHERIQDAFRRFSQVITSHGGIAHEIRGDALVAEFAKASDAVAASLAFQAANARHQDELPDAVRPVVRVGIAMGEVVVADNTVTGEGVVLAQRLEQLAVAGGVCLQGAAYETVPKRLPFDYENLGERELKGFDEPVRVYAVRERRETANPGSEGQAEGVAAAPELAHKPAIAVLPFTNMSGDPEQEYFSDGITEDIITELSRSHDFLVIARNSSFRYKGQSVDVTAVGRELGASYVVEGSVRKAGNRVRVSGQLIEAEGGSHLWAERYDRQLDDIFAIQDDIVQAITIAVLGRLSKEMAARAARKAPASLTAYDLTVRGRWLMNRSSTDQSVLDLLTRATELDPNLARAYVYAASRHAYSLFSLATPPEQAIERAVACIERALRIEDFDPGANAVAAVVYVLMGNHALASHHLDRAIAASPNGVEVVRSAGLVEDYLGNHESARRWYERFKRLDPHLGDASRENFFDHHYMTGEYEQATQMLDGWRSPPWHMYAELAAAYAQLDRAAEAAKAKHQAEVLCPGADVVPVLRRHAAMCAEERDANNWLDGYRKAGFDV